MPRRIVQVRAYWVAVGVAVMVVSPLLSIFAAVQISENRADRTRAESIRFTCAQFSRLLDAYDPVTSSVGQDVRAVYEVLYTLLKCHPPRK